jgi:uncharacterized protein
MTYLADVNVCMALALAGHVHHTVAVEWLEESEQDQIAMCRVAQKGVLRLLTNERVMGANVLNAIQAWEAYDALCENARIRFVEEPPGLEQFWRDATRHPRTGPNFWTDAYVSAFAAAAGFSVVTFDRGFARHGRARVRLLAAPT